MKRILSFLAAVFLVFAINAQDSTAVNDFFDDVNSEFADEKKEETQEDFDAIDKAIELTEDLINQQTDYAIYSLEHRKKVFSWQLIAGKIIFVFVMLIVLSGLVLSFMHFYAGLKSDRAPEGTELEMSADGVKINSSVIGLVILVLAIAFLYLYLVHVFPINEFNVDSTYVP